MKETKKTDISSLGEFALIDHLTKQIKLKHKNTIKGIGDDAAIIKNKGDFTVLTKDLLVENVHFDLTYSPLKHLGYKAAIVNFSDIYAMNAIPEQMLLGIAISSKYTVEALEELYEGILLACKHYNVDFIGGDTTSSQSGLFLSVTAIGKANQEDIVYRTGAKEHDLLCVSGNLGGAYMGLLVLEREKTVFLKNPDVQPELHGFDYVLERQLKPEARKEVVAGLKEIGVKPTSMIDISDGLASEIMHICKDSKLGCTIYEEKIPIDVETEKAAELFNMNPMTAALNGGEDYELLFTISQKDYDKIQKLQNVKVIGHMTDNKNGMQLISISGHQVELKAQGWDSFHKKTT